MANYKLNGLAGKKLAALRKALEVGNAELSVRRYHVLYELVPNKGGIYRNLPEELLGLLDEFLERELQKL